MRRVVAAAAALMLLVILTGCNIASKVVVNPDGSGTYSVILTVPSGKAAGAVLSALQNAATKSRVPLQVTPVSLGGESGAKATFTFQSLRDLNAESAVVASSGDGLGVTIHRDATGWHFSAASATGLTSSPNASAQGSTGGPISGAALTSIATIAVMVQLPGTPAENNATRVTHSSTTTTFSWNLQVGRTNAGLQASTSFVGNQANVQLSSALTPIAPAGSSASGAGSGMSDGTIALIVGGAMVVFVGLGAAAVMARRRKRGVDPLLVTSGSPQPPS
jgi:hypothetical protein